MANEYAVVDRLRESVEADTFLDGIQVSHSDALLILAALAPKRATTDIDEKQTREFLAKLLEAEGHPLVATDIRTGYKTNIGVGSQGHAGFCR